MRLGLIFVVGCGSNRGGGDDDDDLGDGDADSDVDSDSDTDSDSDADLACDDDACGGDPIGSWQIVDSCLDFQIDPPETCPTATVTVDASFTGTASFDADGTFDRTVNLSGDSTMTFPASCLEGATCAQIEAQVQPNFPDITCADAAAGACACTYSIEQDQSDSGTWEVSGSTLTTTGTDGEPEAAEFCVSGDTFLLRLDTGDGFSFAIIATR
jgi:hypothetical protein